MEFLKITEEMLGCSEEYKDGIMVLCKFFRMTDEQIKNDMFYFVNGEYFNFNGWTTSGSSETEINIYEGDVLVFNGVNCTKLPKALHQLEYEYKAAERMESALIKIYESGELSSEMEYVARKGLGHK